jgi:hypothetical protein
MSEGINLNLNGEQVKIVQEAKSKLTPKQFMAKIGFVPDKSKNRDEVEVKNRFVETIRDSEQKVISRLTLFCTPEGFQICSPTKVTIYDSFGTLIGSENISPVMDPIDMNKI